MHRPRLPHSHLYAWAVALVCTVPAAWAQEPPEEAPPSALWVNAGALTYHSNQSKGYNENNHGLGVEYQFRPDTSVMVGSFYNSVRRDTHYAAVNWQPIALGDWKLGMAVGVMNGYPAVKSGNYFVAALPMVSYEGKRFGVNLSLIPNVAKIDGALVVQVKFRLF